MTDFEVMQMALKALEAMQSYAAAEQKGLRICDESIEALRAALERPERQLKRIHQLDMPLEVFVEDLSTRPRNIINNEIRYFTHFGDKHIKPPFTVRHLMMFSRKELRKWPNLGKRSLNEIEELLRNQGLQLWENHDERSLRLLREHPTNYTSPPQQQAEPVAWMDREGDPYKMPVIKHWAPPHTLLYAALPQRMPLTDKTLWEMWMESPSDVLRFARAIEQAHGIGEKT